MAVGCGGSSFSGNASGNSGGTSSSPGGSAAGGDSGVGGSAGGAATGPALTQIPQLYAAGMCTALTSCSAIAASLILGANDCSNLISAEITNASMPGIQSAVAAGTVTYNPSAVADCQSAVAASGCSFADNPYIPACEAALSGKVIAGGACAIDEECQGDLYCKYDGTCPGVCSPREAEGALCRSAKDCQSGLACFVTTGTTGTCTAKPTLGQSCGYDLPGDCSPESNDAVICWGASSTATGKCMAVNAIASQAIGSSCWLLTGSLCVSGASCQFASIALNGTCVATVASANSCTFAYPDPCPQDQYCTATGPNTPGSCSLLPTDGSPCVTGAIQTYSNKLCAADHVCVSGTCTKYRANGAACTSNAVCYSGRCDTQSGLCVPNQNCDIAAASN